MNVFSVSCFLALFTGVVVIEGEQEVDQLKTTGNKPQMTEVEKDSQLEGEKHSKRFPVCTHHSIHAHIALNIVTVIRDVCTI